jgi:hypothetical protein
MGYNFGDWGEDNKDFLEQFYNNFTTFEQLQTLSPFSFLASTLHSGECTSSKAKLINFHLPPPEKKVHFNNTSEIHKETIWSHRQPSYLCFNWSHILSPFGPQTRVN